MGTEWVSDSVIDDPVFGLVIPDILSATALTGTLTRRNDCCHARKENTKPYESFAGW
jgi:hypothetical protein